MNYNQEQIEAIQHGQGPMMVLAGPGSGKTSVITGRTRYLIDELQVAPSSVLVVTFTKAAARQMKERFFAMDQSGIHHAGQVTFGTFHGVFYGILRWAYGFSGGNILSEEEKRQMLKGYIYGHGLEITDENEFLDNLTREISLVKNNKLDLEHFYAVSCSASVFRCIYQSYVKKCKEMHKLDFDDMLVYCYELFVERPDILKKWQEKFRYILIDEFQDINQIQYEIMKMLAAPENNLFIVGDDDQSIYRFRGAKPEIMQQFPKDFPGTKTVCLGTNYRCTKAIVEASAKVIGANQHRYKKTLCSTRGEGDAISIQLFEDERQESLAFLKEMQEYHEQGGIYEEVAVLFRTNMGARVLVEKLVEYNLPFQMKEMLPNLYEHWIAKNFMTYMNMAHGSRNRNDFLQIMNRPNRYISRESLGERLMSFEDLYRFYGEKRWMIERIEEWEMDLRAISRMTPFAAINYIRKSVGYNDYLEEYAGFRQIKADELFEVADEIQQSAKGYETLEQWQEHISKYTEKLKENFRENMKKQEGIVISTLHSVKGLEYNKVYLFDVNEGIIPYHKAILDTDLEEERRMFYVGMTRARDNLSIWMVKKRFDKKQEPSSFLRELQKPQTTENEKGAGEFHGKPH